MNKYKLTGETTLRFLATLGFFGNATVFDDAKVSGNDKVS